MSQNRTNSVQVAYKYIGFFLIQAAKASLQKDLRLVSFIRVDTTLLQHRYYASKLNAERSTFASMVVKARDIDYCCQMCYQVKSGDLDQRNQVL